MTCPIVGYPTPMIEWSKNGEKIDYMWERHRTGKNGRSLKIKHANEDDTGIFSCKGKYIIFKRNNSLFMDIGPNHLLH